MDDLVLITFALLFFLTLCYLIYYVRYLSHKTSHIHHEIAHENHIGDMKFSSTAVDHHGWLLCDGRSFPTSEYPELFSVIGTAFGSSGTSFSLPDGRGRVPGMIGQGSGLTNRTTGVLTGTETFTLTLNELPSHHHTGTTETVGNHQHTGSTGSDGSHSHSVTDAGHVHSQYTYNDDYNGSATNGQTPPAWAKADAFPDDENRKQWSNINSTTTGISVNSAGSHAHTIQADGSHSHTFTSGLTGSGNPFSQFQPTLFVGNMFIFSGHQHHSY